MSSCQQPCHCHTRNIKPLETTSHTQARGLPTASQPQHRLAADGDADSTFSTAANSTTTSSCITTAVSCSAKTPDSPALQLTSIVSSLDCANVIFSRTTAPTSHDGSHQSPAAAHASPPPSPVLPTPPTDLSSELLPLYRRVGFDQFTLTLTSAKNSCVPMDSPTQAKLPFCSRGADANTHSHTPTLTPPPRKGLEGRSFFTSGLCLGR